MENKIWKIVTELQQGDITKNESVSKLLLLYNVMPSLPEREILLKKATEYADNRLPQQYALVDTSDWIEYKDDIIEYILNTVYGKGNEA